MKQLISSRNIKVVLAVVLAITCINGIGLNLTKISSRHGREKGTQTDHLLSVLRAKAVDEYAGRNAD